MSGKFSLVEGEKLCELVRSYFVIYNKSQKCNKGTDTVAKPWKEISQSLVFVSYGKALFRRYSLIVVAKGNRRVK